MSVDDVSRFQPLKPLEFLVLLVLAREGMHGYGVVKAIRDETDGDVDLEPGNLYRYVRSLEATGLIEEIEPPADAPERRRYYGATALGRRVLAAEAARLHALAAAADAVIS